MPDEIELLDGSLLDIPATGCMTWGHVRVNKVPGTLALTAGSPHHSMAPDKISTRHAVTHFSFMDDEQMRQKETGLMARAVSEMREPKGSGGKTK